MAVRAGTGAGRSHRAGGGLALLHLVNFDEPFGFSVIEAMACGTPVITRSRGSMSEIVRHGENGFLVGSLDEAVLAVDDYLAIYHRVVELHRSRRVEEAHGR